MASEPFRPSPSRVMLSAPEHMHTFRTSKAYAQLTGFIAELTNAAVVGDTRQDNTTKEQHKKKENVNERSTSHTTSSMSSSEACTSQQAEAEETALVRVVSSLLDACMELVSSCPRIEGARERYGNPGFRVWVDSIAKHADEVLTQV